MLNWKLKSFFILLLAISIVSCSDDEDDQKSLSIELNGLEDLGSDYAYEGWLIVDGNPVSTGIVPNGQVILNETLFLNVVDEDDIEKASTFVLTIEPNPDNDLAPSNVHILAGDFDGTTADLTVEHSAALGNDFTDAHGEYILATPSDGPDTNEASGLWWLDPSGPSQSLHLPTLPEGWAYEGWAVIDGVPVSTGTFLDPAGIDNQAIYSGSEGTPPFPGEDFLVNAPLGITFPADLAGGAAVISIEPVPDNSAAPFTLKPLVGMIPSNPEVHTLLGMDNNAVSTNPTGKVSR